MSDVKTYTKKEVSERNGNINEMWIIHKDSVYDITTYIKEHPGGEVIEPGKDVTSPFKDVGHSSDALAVLAKLKIGEIVEEEKVYDANGKKKRKVINAGESSRESNNRSCVNICTCGLLG